jgi:NTP-dependent ternary system trypsin peptidase co-occuring protein
MRDAEDHLRFRQLLALCAVWQDDARRRGAGVGNGDGEFPSLADTIAAVRRELSLAQAAGQGQPVQFRTGPVELEFDVAVTRSGGGQAGVQIWVLTLGGKLEREYATTQRIKVTLQPVNPETDEDARITDARQRREPAAPPP